MSQDIFAEVSGVRREDHQTMSFNPNHFLSPYIIFWLLLGKQFPIEPQMKSMQIRRRQESQALDPDTRPTTGPCTQLHLHHWLLQRGVGGWGVSTSVASILEMCKTTSSQVLRRSPSIKEIVGWPLGRQKVESFSCSSLGNSGRLIFHWWVPEFVICQLGRMTPSSQSSCERIMHRCNCLCLHIYNYLHMYIIVGMFLSYCERIMHIHNSLYLHMFIYIFFLYMLQL